MNNQKIYFIILYGILFSVTTIVMILLLSQYYYFKHEAQELAQVKEAYYQHVDMLKRSLNASMVMSEDQDDTQSDQEKKKISFDDQDGDLSEFDLAAENQTKLQFQKISNDEELRLKQIKSGYVISAPVAQAKKRSIKRYSTKKRSVVRLTKASSRYQPIRDFVFSWPVDLEHFWLSSLFGPRKRPGGRMEFHHGIDMAAMRGTPVYAAAQGTVVIAGVLPGYGNCIMVEHNNCYKTRYGHLHKIHVRVGQAVQAGQQIGTVGDTGLVRKSGKDASHLHFEIYQNGQRVNPLSFLFS